MREIVFDTETTGRDPASGHRIVELGCVEIFNYRPTGKTFHSYLNPERDVPEEVVRVHGLTAEFLLDKPLFADIAEKFLEFVGDAPLIIHNAGFDMKFINAEFTAMGLAQMPMSRARDTLQLARSKYPGQPASLDALCRRFGVDNTGRTVHGALLDAELLADVYFHLMGGAQPELFDVRDASGAEESISGRKKTPRPPRSFAIPDEEAAAHQVFIESLGDKAIWRKKAS
ncbi:MAG TPA: DNA polymerase III subunit epsilon [Alphaproteobacteria bacterium]|nr:DNA polymerase III subunit epsilon [Rhodospirillaceae bacterium]HRJ11646.1 DNA polymerase III subunit epsilon [Alphaproteobacteria bacterium]